MHRQETATPDPPLLWRLTPQPTRGGIDDSLIAVTWSLINSSPPDKAGTIVEVLEDGNLLVEGASSGKRGSFLPANLRLA